MNVGERIKRLRKERKLTLRELSEKVDISISFLSDIENGRSNPSLERLKSIAEALDTTVSYLLGEEDNSIKGQPDNTLKLTRRDEREIEKILEETRRKLENAEGLMFDGEPASPEAIQSILDSMRIGLEIAKQRNKQKYTPKKYRKNKKEVGESE